MCSGVVLCQQKQSASSRLFTQPQQSWKASSSQEAVQHKPWLEHTASPLPWHCHCLRQQQEHNSSTQLLLCQLLPPSQSSGQGLKHPPLRVLTQVWQKSIKNHSVPILVFHHLLIHWVLWHSWKCHWKYLERWILGKKKFLKIYNIKTEP